MAFLMITGVGYSLIIAGMTLAWKRIQLLQETFLMLVMIFAVSALPLITVPGWFGGLSRVFPVTSAVTSLYGVMLGHRGVTAPWGRCPRWPKAGPLWQEELAPATRQVPAGGCAGGRYSYRASFSRAAR